MSLGKILTARFYRTPIGNEPVREWLKSLPLDERNLIGQTILAVEMKWPQGMPLVRKMDANLWEVRTILPRGLVRVFFTVWGGAMVLLHGIIKKSQKTPLGELDLAKKRRDEVHRGARE